MTPRLLSRWLVLLGCLLLSSAAFGQTMTLSAPSGASTYVDNAPTVFSISGESGAITAVKLVYTYTSGTYAQYVGQTFTMNLNSTSASQSFILPLATAASSALFTSVEFPSGVTGIPDGVYSVYVQYTRGTNGAVIRSSTASNITFDSSTIPPRFIVGRSATAVDASTDTITIANHGLPDGMPVRVERTNLSTSTTYYVSVVTTSTFKLATTSDLSTIADITTTVLPLILNPAFLNAQAVTVNTTTDVITLEDHGLVDGDLVQIHGTNATSSAVYFVSVVDASSFKLTTTSGGSTFFDFSSAPSPVLYLPWRDGAPSIQFESASAQVIPGKYIRFPYTLWESFRAASARIKFTGPLPTSNATTTVTLPNVVRINDITLDRTNIGGSQIQSTTATSIPDGNYTVELSYADLNNHAAATATVFNLTLDSVTQAPVFGMLNLQTGTTYTNVLTSGQTISSNEPVVYYTLPEEPFPGSATLKFTNTSTTAESIYPLPDSASAHVCNLASGGLTNGTYTVTLSYRDWVGNTAASVVLSNVTYDLTTTAPTLDLGALSAVGPRFDVAYTLPETPKAGSVKLIFTGANGSVTLNLPDALTGDFELNTANLLDPSSPVTAASATALPAGTYTVRLQYQDAAGNAVAYAEQSGFEVITATAPATMTFPAAGVTYHHLPLQYILPQAAATGSVSIAFRSGGNTVAILNMTDTAPTAVIFLNPAVTPPLTAPFVSATGPATGPFLPDGIYDVLLSYSNNLGAPAATTIVSGVKIDSQTLPPTLAKPTAGTKAAVIPVQYTLPEAASWARLDFIARNGGATVNSLALATASGSFTLDPTDLAGSSAAILSVANGNTIPPGSYDVRLVYEDAVGNTEATASVQNVTIDLATGAPTLTTPAASQKCSGLIAVSYALPENPQPGSVKLEFLGGRTITVNLDDALSGSFTLNTSDIINSGANIVACSSNTIPDGAYTVVLSYQDEAGNTTARATSTNVSIDSLTQLPTLAAPNAGGVDDRWVYVSYSLPETPSPGSVKLTFQPAGGGTAVVLTLSDLRSKAFAFDRTNVGAVAADVVSTTSGTLPDGVYDVRLSYADAVGNSAASANSAGVRFGNAPVISSTPAPAAAVNGPSAVTLAAEVHSHGVPTVVTFYRGSTAVGAVNLAPGATAETVSQTVTGLTPNTTYAWSVVAVNLLGTDARGAFTFTTANDDSETQPPSLVAPAAGAVAAPMLAVSYTLPEAPLPDSVKLRLVGPVTVDLGMSEAQTVAFQLDPILVTNSSAEIRSASRNSIPDGVYAVTLSYRDAKGNLAAAVSVGNVTFDLTTKPPVLVTPASGSKQPSSFGVNYVLPETPKPNSVLLDFTPTGGGTTTRLRLTDALVKNFALDRTDLAGNTANVVSSSAPALADGVYDVELSYRDQYGNVRATQTNTAVVFGSAPTFPTPVVTVTSPTAATLAATVHPHGADTEVEFYLGANLAGSTTVSAGASPVAVSRPLTGLTADTNYAASIIARNVFGATSSAAVLFKSDNDDAETEAPTLIAPVPGAPPAANLAVSYTLPEAPKAGTVKLSFAGAVSAVLTMNIAQAVSFTLDPADLAASSTAIVSSTRTTLPDGVYAVTLTYQDAKGNAPASVTVGGVALDRTTQAPALFSPAMASRLGVDFTLNYLLPEAPLPGSVVLKFEAMNGGADVTLNLDDSLGKSIELSRSDLTGTGGPGMQASANVLTKGVYNVSLSYRDSYGNARATTTNQHVEFGDLPAFTNPAVTVTGPTTATYEVTVAPELTDTVVEFFIGSTSLGTSLVRGGTLPSTVSQALAGLSPKTNYAVSILATNIFGSTSSAPLFFTTDTADAATQAPTMTSPATGDAVSRALAIAYELPEPPKPGSVQVSFIGPVTATFPLSNATSASFTVDPTNLTPNPARFTATPLARLPDGIYSVVLSYQDAGGNAPAFATAGNVTIDTATIPPVFTTPSSNTALASKFTVSYTLPEAPGGNVVLSFHPVAGGSDVAIHLNAQMSASFELDRGDLAAATANVVSTSAPTLADGRYDVTLTYHDALGNPAAFIRHEGVVCGSPPIMNPPNVVVLSSSSARLMVGVAAGSADTVVGFFLGGAFQGTTLVPAGTSADLEKVFTGLTAGQSYAATVEITNPFGSSRSAPRAFSTFTTQNGGGGDAGDPAGYKSRLAVGRFERVAGGSSLPEDATYYSFGVPAINDAGSVAFLAKVRSSLGTKAAIVAGDPLKIVAVEGDAAPGVAGATFLRFTDPVIDATGHVAFTAMLAGEGINGKNANTLWTNAPGGVLRLVARVGDVAPDTGTARLKRLTSFSLQSTAATPTTAAQGEVVFTGFLQADGKIGVSAANDCGIWSVRFAADGSVAASECLLREGVTAIDGATVRVFRALDVVKNSPGQGRSHLAPGLVSLIAGLTDGRDVIVDVSSAGGVEVVASSATQLTGTEMNGARLKRLGVPALNLAGSRVAFHGTLTPGTNGVTAANATGIFYGTPDLDPLVRAGDVPPGLSGVVFGSFRDPVMDVLTGEVAFLSTLAGKGAGAGRAETLWWTPQGDLSLLARSGDELPGAPGTRLKSFTSVAFPPGMGPVFVGVLASGTTPVKKTSDTGLWATNLATGELSLLLRKGQKILDGVGLLKTVKSFAVLAPVAGSPGVTRSYNTAGTLVCRVVFEDGAESVMTFSAVPN